MLYRLTRPRFAPPQPTTSPCTRGARGFFGDQTCAHVARILRTETVTMALAAMLLLAIPTRAGRLATGTRSLTTR